MPPVRDYMSLYAAADNDPFGGNHKATLVTYLIDAAAPTNAPGLANITLQIYTASGDAPNAFLLWLATDVWMPTWTPVV